MAVANPKKNQDGHVTSPSSPGYPAHSRLLPQGRRLEATVSSCRYGERQGPILEAGLRAGGGERGTKFKGRKM